MRTKIVIDDDLMTEAMIVTGIASKQKIVETALRTLVRIHRNANVLDLAGAIEWDGDLDAMRTDEELIVF